LRLVLAEPVKVTERRHVDLPVCSREGGTLPGIDLGNAADLLDQMEGIG
jgi:hypothetical protein